MQRGQGLSQSDELLQEDSSIRMVLLSMYVFDADVIVLCIRRGLQT
jgi:hypothetical protein